MPDHDHARLHTVRHAIRTLLLLSGIGLATTAAAVVGSRVGRDGPSGGGPQDVQRCEAVPGGAQPAFWDVSCNFRGQDHRVQLAEAPGRTITVNAQGEPRERGPGPDALRG